MSGISPRLPDFGDSPARKRVRDSDRVVRRAERREARGEKRKEKRKKEDENKARARVYVLRATASNKTWSRPHFRSRCLQPAGPVGRFPNDRPACAFTGTLVAFTMLSRRAIFIGIYYPRSHVRDRTCCILTERKPRIVPHRDWKKKIRYRTLFVNISFKLVICLIIRS